MKSLAALALAAVMLAAGRVAPASAADAAPVAAIRPQAPVAQVDAPRRKTGASKRDAFAPRSWAPPAAAPKAPPVPEFRGPPEPPPLAAPEAPALPLAYLGQLDVEGEATTYYLALGERVHAVQVGGVINGTYQLLPPEGPALAFLYLPLNIKQMLPLRLQP